MAPPVETDPTLGKLNAFKEQWKKDAETLVLSEYPKRILSINKIIESEKFRADRISELQADLNVPVPKPAEKDVTEAPSAKKRKTADSDANGLIEGTSVYAFSNGVVPSNQRIVELVDVVKPIVREIVESMNKVKVWILFLIPRIEDGNNFGVSIQEETLAEVRTVEAEAATVLDQISRYYLTRGKIVSKIARYPHIEDYRRAVHDLDEREFVNLRLVLMEIRNHYSTMHDMIMKNLDKIKTPRNSNLASLY